GGTVTVEARADARGEAAGPGDADVHGPHRLVLLWVGAGDAGDAEAVIGPEAVPHGLGHGDRSLRRNDAVFADDVGGHASFDLRLGPIGDHSALQVVRGAGDVGEGAGEQAAGARLH